MAKTIISEGKTTNEAIENGLKQLNVSRKMEDIKDLEIVKYIDVLVDGPFKKEVKDIKLHWKGSANQRVIDVKKTIDSGKVVVLED